MLSKGFIPGFQGLVQGVAQQPLFEFDLSPLSDLQRLLHLQIVATEEPSHLQTGFLKSLRPGKFSVNSWGQKGRQRGEDIPNHVGQSQDLGTHVSIWGDADNPWNQEIVHLIFQSGHMLQKDFNGETKIATGEALSGLETGSGGGL